MRCRVVSRELRMRSAASPWQRHLFTYAIVVLVCVQIIGHKMRIPHTIPRNTQVVYQPSYVTLGLQNERERQLRPEDFTWDADTLPSLVAYCVSSLVANFQNNPVYEDLPDEDRDLLLETLPLDLPLELMVPIIEDGIYWERRSEDRWDTMNYVPYHGNSWKRLYLERYLQEYLETLPVEDYDTDTITSLLNLCAPYVHKVELRQLQITKPRELTEKEIEEFVLRDMPTDHIDLEPVLRLLVNLEEFHVAFGISNCAHFFEWRLFTFSVQDCTNIGLGLDSASKLTVLRIHRSNLDDPRVCVILQHLLDNTTLLELDLSHCRLSDSGALALGKVMIAHPTLQRINLCNNRIGPRGVEGLAYALQRKGCPLKYLNLRLNVIGEAGISYLCAGLAHSTRPQELILAGCGINDMGTLKIGQMLQQNKRLYRLDLSNNNLDEVGGEALYRGMRENSTVCVLDLRMTQIPQEMLEEINIIVKRNYDNSKVVRRQKKGKTKHKIEDVVEI